MAIAIILENGLPEPSAWMYDVARRSRLPFVTSSEVATEVRTVFQKKASISEGERADALDSEEPRIVIDYFLRRGLNQISIIAHNDFWIGHAADAAGCILDLSSFTIARRGVGPGEDRIHTARRLLEARHMTYQRILARTPRNRILYLPSRISDQRRIELALSLLVSIN